MNSLTEIDYQPFGFEKTLLRGEALKDFLRENEISVDLIEGLKPRNPFFLVLTKKGS